MAADEDQGKGGAPRQRPPVTIDLTAEEVRAKAAAAPEAAAKPEPPKDTASEAPRSGDRRAAGQPSGRLGAAARALSSDDGWRQNALAGVAGGLIALVVAMLLQAVGVLPAPGRSAANQAIEQAKAAAESSTALDRRLTAVEAMTESIPALRADLRDLADRMAVLEAGRTSLATKDDVTAATAELGEIRQRLDAAAPSATRDDLAVVAERVGRLEVAAAAGGNGSASSEAINSLSAQLANAEAQVRSLTDRIAAAEAKVASPGAGTGAATRALAIAALRRAAEGSAPFAGDVDMVVAAGVSGDDIAALRPIAGKGAASAAALMAEFPAVADAILAATAASDPNAGFFQRILGGLGSLVSIRPVGPVAGSDPPAVVSRMSDFAAKGDLAAALAEREALPAAGKEASAEWAAKAADRVGLDAIVERIARALDPPKAG